MAWTTENSFQAIRGSQVRLKTDTPTENPFLFGFNPLYWGCLEFTSISGNLFPFIPILRKLRLYVSHLSRRPF